MANSYWCANRVISRIDVRTLYAWIVMNCYYDHPRKVSFALRTLANTSTSESLAVAPTFLRISSLISTRRKGLVLFSTPIMEGTVGSPRDLLATISSIRVMSSAFPGSTLLANFAFAAVYS